MNSRTNIAPLKIFARVKPGVTRESVNEEEMLEEEHNDTKQKNIYDEQPNEHGWIVSGTVKTTHGYKRPAFVREIIQVETRRGVTLRATDDFLLRMTTAVN